MTNRVDWSDEQEACLRLVWVDSTICKSGVEAALGVSFRAAKNKARRLALGNRPKATYAGRPWLDEDDAELRAVFAAGGDTTAAARTLVGRTRYACGNRAKKLGLKSVVAPRLPPLPSVGGPTAEPARPAQVAPAWPLATAPIAPAKVCQYPLWGNAERATHRLCESPIFQGSYCVDHFGVCYLSRRAQEAVF